MSQGDEKIEELFLESSARVLNSLGLLKRAQVGVLFEILIIKP